MNSLFPSRALSGQPIRKSGGTAIVLAFLLLFQALAAPAKPAPNYTEGTPSRDGIGKFYEGREIAKVMGHLGAGWLERPERVQEERTDLLLSLLDLQSGDTVADIGAGTGYFSLPMARMVGPEGRVLAVDIQAEMLDIIESRLRSTGMSNVTTVLATPSDPGLPAGEVDAVLMVDAYHEFSHPFEVMSGIRDSLSERGRVILVEYRGEDPAVPIKPLHKMTVAQATREMAAVGLALDKVLDDLPWQHVMIFRRTPASETPPPSPAQ